jgi:dihydroorotate dehydrogenase (NAD+) catalytic subunit
MTTFLGKKIRGRFGFPSGVIATNGDTARWMLENVPQLGFFVGKSTTIESREGNPEDILSQPTPDSLWNAVGYANPGLEVMVESFRKLRETAPHDVFLMPQIGEGTAKGFAHCIAEFDRAGEIADGYEINLSCPHADKGGVLIGSDPDSVTGIVAASRSATSKPLVVKLNAGVEALEDVARAAAAAGADALSAINTLGGPNPEISRGFGGLSGASIFPTTVETVRRIRSVVDLPMIVMGGIRGAADIRKLEESGSFFYAIGTALGGLDSVEIREYFGRLEIDLEEGTDTASTMTLSRMLMDYRPFIVSDVVDFNDALRLIRFREGMDAEIGQFVFLKLASDASKPFSVASDREGLELVVRKVGPATSRALELRANDVVRIRGPYGTPFTLPAHRPVIFVGAGCGIAPILHAAEHHDGPKRFILGTTTSSELVYIDEFREMGEVSVSTDDGSAGREGFVTSLLEEVLAAEQPKEACFFNCGPEIAMRGADRIEREYAPPEDIYHLVERMTSCGIGICGKCSIPSGERLCVDGPVFSAASFVPGEYTRDKTGKRIPI